MIFSFYIIGASVHYDYYDYDDHHSQLLKLLMFIDEITIAIDIWRSPS